MKTESNDRKPYEVLTEKQIIKQLKCLIAKQEQEINKLIKEVQRLKFQQENDLDGINKNKSIVFSNLQSSRGLDKVCPQKQGLSRNPSSHASVIHSKNSTSRSHKNKIQSSSNELILNDFQKQIKEFTENVLQPFNNKYLVFSKKSGIEKHRPDNLTLENNLKNENYESFASFSAFIPSFLKQTKTIIKNMDHLIEQKSSLQQSLSKKITEQQNTLKQMMKEYQKNIIDSQQMESKLVEQIKRLKSSNSNQYFAQTLDYSRQNYG